MAQGFRLFDMKEGYVVFSVDTKGIFTTHMVSILLKHEF